MTDMEKVLKNSLHNYKKTAETFARVSKSNSESKGNMINKIYKVEVVIDGQTVFEHYGKNADEMNKQYLVALEMCRG